MAKRRADKTLNRDNWDEEDGPEEAGEFERASDEVIARRTIRKAKRTVLPTTNNAPRASPFTGFSFFENGGSNPPGSTTPTMASSAVSSSNGNRTSDEYLSKVAKLNRDILECITRLMDNGAYLNLTPCFEDYMKHFQRLTREEEDRQRKNNNGTASSGFSLAVSPGSSMPDPSNARPPAEAPKQTFSFDSQGANKTSLFGGSASSSPFKPDSPSKAANTENNAKQKFEFAKPVVPNKNFSFGVSLPASKADQKKDTENNSKADFLFGKPAAKVDKESEIAGADSTAPQQSLFGSQFTSPFTPGNSSTGTQPFSFGSSSTPASSFGGFAMNSSQTTVGTSQTTNDDDEEDQPPKVDIAPVGDEGSLYTKKVKLYYKKKESDEKGAFAEKGIGFLHILALDGGAHQLLVRAQTTLGNVLLNIRLGKNLPVSRVGNNNVAIVCVPNPPLNPDSQDKTPTMFLIKVKSREDAAELHDKLVEFKGAA